MSSQYTWKDDGQCVCEKGVPYADMALSAHRWDSITIECIGLEGDIHSLQELDNVITALTRLRDQIKAGELPETAARIFE